MTVSVGIVSKRILRATQICSFSFCITRLPSIVCKKSKKDISSPRSTVSLFLFWLQLCSHVNFTDAHL